jgi:NAD(P)-dependent dehydrogenase (short-subunit alcohol dehydrogenase family)
MDLHLSGKTAVVTGASKGIGLAITRALVDAGAYVVAGSRTRGTELEGLEDAGQVTFVPADLATPQGASDLVATAADRGGIDVLINNAGSLTVHPAGFAGMTDEDWQASWNLNVMGTVRPTRAALPQMYRRGGGSIVIVGSMRAYYPDSAYYDYCATKAAVTNIAKSLSNELGPRNIRVNSVSPGPVSTPLWLGTDGLAHAKADGSGRTVDEVVASAVSGAATGRFTTPEEVADLVIFLASDRSANTTGADMRIDGGVVGTL